MKPVSMIVSKYRKQQKLSLRKFAQALTHDLNHGIEISHQTVKNWEDGVHMPEFSFVLNLALTAHNWRGDFAFDLLSVLKPEIYQPVTTIGFDARKAMKKEQVNS
jgi:transcriptional regulator with XRE-family HTH domain